MKLLPAKVWRTRLSLKPRRNCTCGLSSEPYVAVAIKHPDFGAGLGLDVGLGIGEGDGIGVGLDVGEGLGEGVFPVTVIATPLLTDPK